MKLLALLSVLLLSSPVPAFADDVVLERIDSTPVAATQDIEVKTGGYSTELQLSDKALETLQPVPNVEEKKEKKDEKKEEKKTPPPVVTDSNAGEVAEKPPSFFGKFHPRHIEQYHPKLNKGWNCYMFMYEHGGRQTLDITSKVCQIMVPFVI